MARKTPATPQAAFARVNRSARWNSRIIEKCLGVFAAIAMFLTQAAVPIRDLGMRLALCASMQLSRFRAFAACLLAFALAFAFFTPVSAADPDLDVKVQIVGEEIRAQVSLFVK